MFLPGQITDVHFLNGVAVWKLPKFTEEELTGFMIRLYTYVEGSLEPLLLINITDPCINWWLPERMPVERPLYFQVGCNAEEVGFM